LQKFAPTVTVPWWNTGYDSQAPELSPIWDEAAFGTNGDPAKGHCVQDGAFKNYRPFYPKDHCLMRNWTTEDTIGAFHSTDVLNKIFSSAYTYEAFRRGIEYTPHGVVHNNVGGDMSTMLSPSEPIFWLHHSNVDKWWNDWQRTNKTRFWMYDGKYMNGQAAKLTDVMPGSNNIHVGDVMDTRLLCYYYVDMKLKDVKPMTQPRPTIQPGKKPTPKPVQKDTIFQARRLIRRAVTPSQQELDASQEMHAWQQLMKELDQVDQEPLQPLAIARAMIASSGSKKKGNRVKLYKPPKNRVLVKPSDRSNLLALRIPPPLPERWLRMNGLSPTSVRAQEMAVANVTKDLNELSAKGYVSPSALWNQQDKVAKLVDKVDGFVADLNGTRVVVNVTHNNSSQSINQMQQVVDSVKQVAPSGQVQKPIEKVAANLTDIIGPPVLQDKDAASNPFAPRHEGEQGFSNKDANKLLDKVEANKDKERDAGVLTPKKEQEQAQKEHKIDLALGGGIKSINSTTTIVSVKSMSHTPPPVWIPSDEWQG
jgi:tyrosinase